MKLRIEHESANRVCFEDYLETPGRPGDMVLKLDIRPQVFENGCWAAISAGIGQYFNTGKWNQYQVARAVLELDGFEMERPDHALNQEANLDKGLVKVGCFSHWSPGRPTFDRVVHEINAFRPVCVRIEWFHGGAHYVVIRGVNPETKTLHISDPKYGSSLITYRDFPGTYRTSGGVWTETFWTKKTNTGLNRNQPQKEKKINEQF